MPEYVASAPRVELEPLLGVLALGPLTIVALILVGLATGGRLRALVQRSGWIGLAVSGGLAAWFAYRLSGESRILLHALAPSLRIGSLEAAVVFELERSGAWLLAGIEIVLAFVALRLPAKDRAARPLLVTNSIGVGAALALLSDNVVYALLGLWTLELGRAVARRPRRSPFLPADAALLVGFALLFWGLGGSWSPGEGFVPELRPRLAVLQRPGGATDAPTLTLTSLPGAEVRLGGARLCEISSSGRPGGVGTATNPCWKVATAPFVDVPVRPGVHTLIVSAGPGTDELSIENLRLEGPREIAVTGPSLVFREIRAGLELKDDAGNRPFEATLARAVIFGLPVATLVAVLIGFGLGARIGALASLGLREAVRPFELIGACAWLFLFVRVAFLLEFAPMAFAVAFVAGMAAALAYARFSGRLAELASSAGRRLRSLDARVAGGLTGAALVLVSSSAAASSPIAISPLEGSAPLELTKKDGVYEAGFVVENRGTERAQGLRLFVPNIASPVPENPAGLAARFADGADTLTLEPGQSRRGIVRFTPSQRPALREAFGHVLVVDDERTHAAIGVHVETDDDFVEGHGLSLVLLCPILGLIGIGASALSRYRRLPALRFGFVAIACAKLGLLLWLWPRFDSVTSRLDGNGGYQFIERVLISRSLGLEYFVGVDGFGLVALLALAVIFVVGSLLSLSVARDVPKFLATALLLDLGLSLVVMAVDTTLLVAALFLAVAVRLVLAGTGRASRLITSAGALALTGGLVLSLEGVPQGYLVDGTPNPGAPSLFALAQASTLPLSDPPLLALALFIAGALALAGAPPFHSLNLALLRKTHPAAAPLAIVAVSSVMWHLVLRVGLGALPDALSELAPYLTWFGVAAVVHAALACSGAKDLLEATIYAAGAHAGVVLVGLASGTAIGIQGTEFVVLGGSLGAAGALAVAVAIDSRMPSVARADVRGVGTELVDLGVLSAAVFGALALAPLSATFVGLLLVVIGALPSHPLAGSVLAVAAASLALTLVGVWQRPFSGTFADAHRTLPELEPYAGRLPALSARERIGFALVSLVSSGLGLWPRPVCDVTDTSAVDYAEPVNPPGPLQVSQTATSVESG